MEREEIGRKEENEWKERIGENEKLRKRANLEFEI